MKALLPLLTFFTCVGLTIVPLEADSLPTVSNIQNQPQTPNPIPALLRLRLRHPGLRYQISLDLYDTQIGFHRVWSEKDFAETDVQGEVMLCLGGLRNPFPADIDQGYMEMTAISAQGTEVFDDRLVFRVPVSPSLSDFDPKRVSEAAASSVWCRLYTSNPDCRQILTGQRHIPLFLQRGVVNSSQGFFDWCRPQVGLLYVAGSHDGPCLGLFLEIITRRSTYPAIPASSIGTFDLSDPNAASAVPITRQIETQNWSQLYQYTESGLKSAERFNLTIGSVLTQGAATPFLGGGYRLNPWVALEAGWAIKSHMSFKPTAGVMIDMGF